MGELIFKSAGVSTREIDLSGPTVAGPTGVPAPGARAPRRRTVRG